ncbi:acetyltransferase [Bombilactobacillus folatiphilus]|uniref:Acetyltransferase n=1 Tax=Bombilactobacillus folatiphilus TaxID=2923362 RepID=A0ABY4PB69_9LACO|nr:acyltransferase family protein [Bombilactobacillus folatiphilus]UQS82761.1 acetyltransferase [Bombilactobacillus folatiphilus]
MEQVKQKSRYITGFDGLRTLGVIGVILYHLNPAIFAGGYLGVPIFLVLSGYLITDQILRSLRIDGHFSLKQYYGKRIRRLYPGLLLMLFSASAYITLFQQNLLKNLRSIFVTNVLNVYNFWQILHGQSYFDRFANNESPFTHLWTLSLQGQFYFLWPLLLILLLRWFSTKKFFTITFLVTCFSAVLMALLYNPHLDPSRVYYGTDTRMFSLLLGCLLAMMWPSNNLRTTVRRFDRNLLNIVGTVAFVGMLFLIFKMKATDAFTYRGGIFLFSVLTTLLVAVIAHPAAMWNRLLTNPLFAKIGKISYGLYLYQFPVMIFFESKFKNVADHPLLYPIVEIVLIFGVSWMSYYFVESPLGKGDWRQLLKQWARPSHLLIEIVLLVIVFLGSVGLIRDNGQAVNADHSPLAQKIAQNKSQNVSHNQQALKVIKKNQQVHNHRQVKKWQKLAQKHPVNQRYQKLGISQFDLQRAQDLPALAVGDSVMVDGSDGLRAIFPKMVINADVSRGIEAAITTLSNYKDQNALPQTIIMGIGTNGAISEKQVVQVLNLAGAKRQVFWINVHVPTRSWEKSVNDLLQSESQKYHNLHVIDWYEYSQAHPKWFYDDQVHTNDQGSKYYSTLIAKSILKQTKY